MCSVCLLIIWRIFGIGSKIICFIFYLFFLTIAQKLAHLPGIFIANNFSKCLLGRLHQLDHICYFLLNFCDIARIDSRNPLQKFPRHNFCSQGCNFLAVLAVWIACSSLFYLIALVDIFILIRSIVILGAIICSANLANILHFLGIRIFLAEVTTFFEVVEDFCGVLRTLRPYYLEVWEMEC